MSLVSTECKVCGDVFIEGGAFQLETDYLCWDCWRWGNKLLYELTKAPIYDTV